MPLVRDAALLLAAASLWGQTAPPRPAAAPRPISSGGGGGGDFWEWHWSLGALAQRQTVVTQAPYSADYVSENVMSAIQGPDGSPWISHGEHYRVYRDSEGRTRYERYPATSGRPNGRTFPPMVEIRDPVAGFTYIVDMEAQVTHRVAMDAAGAGRGGRGTLVPRPQMQPPMVSAELPAQLPAQTPPPMAVYGGSMVGSPQVPRPVPPAPALPRPAPPVVEDLGDQIIEGVLAHGQRTTHTNTPPPGRGGVPQTVVSERWHSAELNVDVLTKNTTTSEGAANSEMTQKLVNISRVEPDPLLFQPPVEFRIVDETGAGVAVSYSAQ